MREAWARWHPRCALYPGQARFHASGPGCVRLRGVLGLQYMDCSTGRNMTAEIMISPISPDLQHQIPAGHASLFVHLSQLVQDRIAVERSSSVSASTYPESASGEAVGLPSMDGWAERGESAHESACVMPPPGSWPQSRLNGQRARNKGLMHTNWTHQAQAMQRRPKPTATQRLDYSDSNASDKLGYYCGCISASVQKSELNFAPGDLALACFVGFHYRYCMQPPDPLPFLNFSPVLIASPPGPGLGARSKAWSDDGSDTAITSDGSRVHQWDCRAARRMQRQQAGTRRARGMFRGGRLQ